MSHSADDVKLITDLNVNEYFNDDINNEIKKQNVNMNEENVVYIVNMLT